MRTSKNVQEFNRIVEMFDCLTGFRYDGAPDRQGKLGLGHTAEQVQTLIDARLSREWSEAFRAVRIKIAKEKTDCVKNKVNDQAEARATRDLANPNSQTSCMPL